MPISNTLRLAGISKNGPNGTETVRDPNLMQKTLAEEWQPVFDAKYTDETEAENLLNSSKLPYFDPISDPNYFDHLRYSKTLKNKTPGTNMIPDVAWQVCPQIGIPTITAYSQHLFSGAPPHEGFNDSGIGFPPKGEKSLDAVEVFRSAKETRPISLKNSDNKFIVGAAVRKLAPEAKTKTHESQRGFVSGRNFLNNVLDLDSIARILSMYYIHKGGDPNLDISKIPILAFFDFETAFPSVAHAWIRLVLRHRKVPQRQQF